MNSSTQNLMSLLASVNEKDAAPPTPPKLKTGDHTPDKTIVSRTEVYTGGNLKYKVYQDVYADGRKDVTYEDKKTGQLYAKAWEEDNNKNVNYDKKGTMDLKANPTAKLKSENELKNNKFASNIANMKEKK